MTVDEAGVEIALAEFLGAAQRGEKAGIAARADHDGLVERARQPVERFVAAFAVSDQLGDHRIVERRDLGARFDAGVDAQALALRELQRHQLAGRRQEAALGIFRIKPRLDRVAIEWHLRLAERQLFAGGDAELPFHQIEAGDGFGHRMLDLQPRVHLHEPEAVGFQPAVPVGDELDRAGALVTGGLGGGDSGLAHRRPQRGAHAGRRAPPRSLSGGGAAANSRAR